MSFRLQIWPTKESGHETNIPSSSSLVCDVCPHYCCLNNGDIGKCHIRGNKDNQIQNLYEGIISLASVDSIEKRPFFHFYPGSRFLSVGLYGCSFQCKFCMNFSVSQTAKSSSSYRSPHNLVKLALQKKVKGIVFTYNEPTIHYEYVRMVAEVGRTAGLEIAIKSNGYVTERILKDLSAHVDAWNIDVKGDDEEYETTCGGTLAPVLQTIDILSNLDTHLEISYLVLPRLADDFAYHARMCDYFTAISKDLPIHLLYFYPFYKMESGKYEKSLMLDIYDLFREKMNYVYISNLYDSDISKRSTYCVKCGKELISRSPLPREIITSCCGQNIAGIFG